MRFISISMLIGAGLLLGSAAPTLAQTTAAQTTAAQTTAVQTAYSTAESQAATDHRIVLRLQQRRVYLYRGDMLVSSYPVAVGADETPTPQGEFEVSQMIVDPVWQSPWTGEVHQAGPDSALGLRWIQFAANDEGVFGFHGTPTVNSIGKAASNGCVRMRNEDVVALFNQVGVGTSVTVQQ
jgi:lipoprotein-anchoring transpeptidase ErfK/SrfK